MSKSCYCLYCIAKECRFCENSGLLMLWNVSVYAKLVNEVHIHSSDCQLAQMFAHCTVIEVEYCVNESTFRAYKCQRMQIIVCYYY